MRLVDQELCSVPARELNGWAWQLGGEIINRGTDWWGENGLLCLCIFHKCYHDVFFFEVVDWLVWVDLLIILGVQEWMVWRQSVYQILRLYRTSKTKCCVNFCRLLLNSIQWQLDFEHPGSILPVHSSALGRAPWDFREISRWLQHGTQVAEQENILYPVFSLRTYTTKGFWINCELTSFFCLGALLTIPGYLCSSSTTNLSSWRHLCSPMLQLHT